MTDDTLYKNGVPWQHTAVADEARVIAERLDHIQFMDDVYTPTYVPPSTPSGNQQELER